MKFNPILLAGRQLFRVFLHDALAEENLSFIESYEKFTTMTSANEKKRYIQEFFEKYSPYVNLSSVALQVKYHFKTLTSFFSTKNYLHLNLLIVNYFKLLMYSFILTSIFRIPNFSSEISI